MTHLLAPRLPHSLQHLLIALLLVVACHSPAIGQIPASAQPARVIQVIDGDTVVVEFQKRREHLRLIGIDTPETRPNRRSEIQAHDRHMDQKTIFQLGNRASNFTRELLPKNSTIFIEFDVDRRDRYQRLLGYIWVRPAQTTTEVMANEALLKAGYAYLLTVPPNVKYRKRLSDAFAEGRREKRGLWQR